MNKQKRWSKVVLILLLWIAVLLSLTPLVALTTGRILRNTKVDVEERNHQTFFNVEEVYLSGNIFGDISISGWAFIENDGDNSDKQINLIFASEGNTYTVETTTIDRFDLRVASVLSDYEIPLSRNGFEATFSPMMMRNGVYNLYVQVFESNTLTAIADTGKIFTKHNYILEEDIGGREVSTISGQVNSDISVKTYFVCNIEASTLIVQGWAFTEEGGVAKLPPRPLVKITRSDDSTAFFSTARNGNIDLVREFGNYDLLLSEFSSKISTSALGSGENIISIVFDGLGESEFTCTIP